MKRAFVSSSETVFGGIALEAGQQQVLGDVAQRLVHRLRELGRGHDRLDRVVLGRLPAEHVGDQHDRHRAGGDGELWVEPFEQRAPQATEVGGLLLGGPRTPSA